jgi:hypothetical protein
LAALFFDFDGRSGFPFSFALILHGWGGKVLIIVAMDSSQGGAKSIRHSTGDEVVGAEIRVHSIRHGEEISTRQIYGCIAGVINASPFPAMGCCLSLLLLLCRVDLSTSNEFIRTISLEIWIIELIDFHFLWSQDLRFI